MSSENALQILKDWWISLEPNDKRPKFDKLATNEGIEIRYRFYTPSGPNAFINAEKDNKSIRVMSLGQPDDPDAFFNVFSENIKKGGGAANQKRKRVKRSRRVKRSKRSTRRRHRK
jgi:hypothetical protein